MNLNIKSSSIHAKAQVESSQLPIIKPSATIPSDISASLNLQSRRVKQLITSSLPKNHQGHSKLNKQLIHKPTSSGIQESQAPLAPICLNSIPESTNKQQQYQKQVPFSSFDESTPINSSQKLKLLTIIQKQQREQQDFDDNLKKKSLQQHQQSSMTVKKLDDQQLQQQKSTEQNQSNPKEIENQQQQQVLSVAQPTKLLGTSNFLKIIKKTSIIFPEISSGEEVLKSEQLQQQQLQTQKLENQKPTKNIHPFIHSTIPIRSKGFSGEIDPIFERSQNGMSSDPRFGDSSTIAPLFLSIDQIEQNFIENCFAREQDDDLHSLSYIPNEPNIDEFINEINSALSTPSCLSQRSNYYCKSGEKEESNWISDLFSKKDHHAKADFDFRCEDSLATTTTTTTTTTTIYTTPNSSAQFSHTPESLQQSSEFHFFSLDSNDHSNINMISEDILPISTKS